VTVTDVQGGTTTAAVYFSTVIPVGLWNGDGSNGVDGTGNTPGTPGSAVGLTTGLVGQAFDLNGAENNFVNVGDDASLQLTNNFTVAAAVRPTRNDSTDDVLWIFTKGNASVRGLLPGETIPFGGWGVGLVRGGGIRLRVNTLFGAVDYNTGFAYLSLDTWTHVGVSFSSDYDGSFVMLNGQTVPQNATGTALFYVNGTLVETVRVTSVGWPAQGGTANGMIGAKAPQFIHDTPQRWTGQIDEVQVYDQVVDAAAIQTLSGKNSVGVGGPVPTVANVPLTAGTASTTLSLAGTIATNLSATFSDANTYAPSSHYVGSIDWGDGSTTPFTSSAVSGSAGNYTISSSHLYSQDGRYNVSVMVNDRNGASTSMSTTASVDPVTPPSITAFAGSSLASGGNTDITLSGAFTDAALPDDTHTATVEWTDGATVPVTINGTTFTSTRSFPAGTATAFVATLTLTDEWGIRTVPATYVNTFGSSFVLSTPVPGHLVIEGGGPVTLMTPSTFSGEITIIGGTTLKAGAANVFSPNAHYQISAGATLDTGGYSQSVGGISGAGDVNLGTNRNATFTFGSDNLDSTHSGNLTGSAELIKVGTGTQTVTGSYTNDGDTTINGGTLRGGAANALSPSSTYNVNAGATLDTGGFDQRIYGFGGAGNVYLGTNPNATLFTRSDEPNVFSGNLSGAGNFHKSGAGTLSLGGRGTFSNTGATIIDNGTLQTDSSNVLSPTSLLVLGTNGTLDTRGTSQTVGGLAGDGEVKFDSFYSTDLLTFGGNNQDSAFDGTVSGLGSLNKVGTGTQTFTGSLANTGTTTISGGTVELAAANVLSSSSQLVVSAGATLQTGGFDQTVGGLAGAGDIDLGNNPHQTFTFGGNNLDSTYSGNLSGAGAITKVGTGTQTVSGSLMNFGTTTIAAGTLLGGDTNAFSPNSVYDVQEGATLHGGSFGQTLGNLIGDGNVEMPAGLDPNATLSFGQSQIDGEWRGFLRSGINIEYRDLGNGTGIYTISGEGMFVIEGGDGRLTRVTIEGGRFFVNGIVTSQHTAALEFTRGAVIRGTGFINGVNVRAAGDYESTFYPQIYPGNSPGILHTDGVVITRAALGVDIGGNVPGTGYSQVVDTGGTGDFILGPDAYLELHQYGGYVPVVGDQYMIIQNDGSNPIQGTFFDLPEGSVISNFLGIASLSAYITYQGGDGNDVVITVVAQTSITDVTRLERNSGIANFVFTVQLSAPSANTVSVAFATADGSGPAGATALDDYTATSGRLTFEPGQTRASVVVAVRGDAVVELDETFFINLSDPINAALGDAQATGTILNDDVVVRIRDVSVTEGNTGVVNANFIVTRSQSQPLGNVTVAFSTADGTATAGSDYTATSGTVTFTPGELQKTITVPVFGDLARESNETFFVNLTSVTNAVIADRQGKGTIVNDDHTPLVNILPALGVSPVVVTEPDSGSTPAEFLVTLSAASGQPVSVRFTTANGTARAGRDYKTVRGTLTFAPGQTQQTISVPVFADLVDEPDETFFVRLSSQRNAVLRDRTAQGTIKDHPSPGRHRARVYQRPGEPCGERYDQKDHRGDERRAGDERTERDGRGEPVGRDQCDLDDNGLTGPLDYFARETSKTVAVSVLVDAVLESEETFSVHLANAANAVIGDGQGTISNDD
jgi:autotransporter-associated beta strand protein